MARSLAFVLRKNSQSLLLISRKLFLLNLVTFFYVNHYSLHFSREIIGSFVGNVSVPQAKFFKDDVVQTGNRG